jgi:NACHT domain
VNLNESHIRKSDPILLDRLMHAKEGEVLRVAMTLNAESSESGQTLTLPTLDPAQFPSRVDYRQALIQQQQARLTMALGSTMQELQDLSLKTYGGHTSRVIVAEGTAKQIIKSLELSGVYHASFDQVIATPPSNETMKSAEYLTQIAIKIFENHEDVAVPNRALTYQSFERYIENYKDHYCRLKILGMRKAIELESIYTEVRFLDDTDIVQFISLQEMEKAYRKRYQKHQRHSIRLQSGIEVANQEQFLMVLGAPGAGKSTFLRRIGVESINGNSQTFEHQCIATLVEIKQFNNSDFNLFEFIANEFQVCKLPVAQKFTKEALHQGKLLILLDGLDEVPTKYLSEVVVRINEFVEQYPKNRYIISCRSAAYQNQFHRFTNVTVADFGDQQIKQFVVNWFNQDKEKNAGVAEKCWELLKSPDYQATKELAHTPLLLTLLCYVYDDYQFFPRNRSELYKDALDILLRKWAAEKRISQDVIFKDLSANQEEMLLSEIAATGFEANKYFFLRSELIQKIQILLVNNVNISKQLTGDAVLNAIVVQQGILIERAEDTYCFSHLTLQEYLTALYICNHNKIEQLVIEHLTNPRWREVFVLAAGIIREGADGLLLSMEKQTQSYVMPDEIRQWSLLTDRFTLDGSKLHSLLNWADQVVTQDSKFSYGKVVERTVAITVTLILRNFFLIDFDFDHTIDRTIACAFSFCSVINDSFLVKLNEIRSLSSDFSIPVAIEIACICRDIGVFKPRFFTDLIDQLQILKTQVRERELSHEQLRNLVNQVQILWSEALQLDMEILYMSATEVEALEKYFYAYEMVVRCKEASAQVSIQTWSSIQERMIKAPIPK